MIINISRSQIDAINLAGILLSFVGFFYLSYVLFERKPLKWFVRIITPTISGAFILASVGVLEIVYVSSLVDPVSAEPSNVIRTGAIYACIGGFIGAFNGYFVEWPLVSKKPHRFSPVGSFIGLIFMSFICSLITFEYSVTLTRSFIEGVVLVPLGAVTGGFWPVINWTPSTYTGKAPKISWKGCLVGLVFTFLFGFVISLLLGRSPIFSLVSASLLAPTGIIAGGLWQFFTKDSSFLKLRPSNIKTNSHLQNDLLRKAHEKRGNLITNLNEADYTLLTNLKIFENAPLIPIENSASFFNSLFEWEYTKEGILVQKGKARQISSSKNQWKRTKLLYFH